MLAPPRIRQKAKKTSRGTVFFLISRKMNRSEKKIIGRMKIRIGYIIERMSNSGISIIEESNTKNTFFTAKSAHF